jgi:hypothetical protein
MSVLGEDDRIDRGLGTETGRIDPTDISNEAPEVYAVVLNPLLDLLHRLLRALEKRLLRFEPGRDLCLDGLDAVEGELGGGSERERIEPGFGGHMIEPAVGAGKLLGFELLGFQPQKAVREGGGPSF